MKESEDLFTPHTESPQTRAWFDLLRHLSAPSLRVGKFRARNSYLNSTLAVLRH
jgi:hypothetical protein